MRKPECPRCEEMSARVAWLESELGLRVEAGETALLRERLRIPPAMAKLVLLLHAAKDSVVPPCQMAEAIPERDHATERADDRLILVYVTRLRKALGRNAIENVWGVGYRLTEVGHELVAAALRAPSEVGEDALLSHCTEPGSVVVEFPGEGGA